MFQNIYYFAVLICVLFSTSANGQNDWEAVFKPEKLLIHMNTQENTHLTITNVKIPSGDFNFHLRSENTHLATVDRIIKRSEFDQSNGVGSWSGNITVSAIFLGNTKIYVELITANNKTERRGSTADLTIIREDRVIDHVFTGSVAALVSLLYINFGAALDLDVMKGIFKRPIGPAIGIFGQFVLMPVLSYAIGYILFPDVAELHLGLFFTGVSPAGGASNIWTVILQGNLNLSVTMTTISTFAAFAMMPLWIFTLGKVIFDRGNLGVPYDRIATFAVALIIPLFIGIAIQKFLPKLSRILVRLLKPISMLLILFIVIFAIVTNLYLFELFSWQIVVAGLGLPWLGYIFGWVLAKLAKQNTADSIAIAVETGIQNTGIAIFLLRFSLMQPQADLTTVIPVSVAIMTPIPLFFLYIGQKIYQRRKNRDDEPVRILDNNDTS